MNKNIQDAINDQIQAEAFSAYLYHSMALYCKAQGLNGSASWFKVQAQEEWGHAEKFMDFLQDRDGTVVLKALEQPESDFGSLLNAFKEALKHEKYVTSRIHDLYNLATKENDIAFQSFLKWFVDEQVEEEATASEIVQKIELAGDHDAGLYMVDQELAQRTVPTGI